MQRKAILHIGTEKTGTTTLQVFMKTNRDLLLASGFRYPRFCGNVNQTGLAAYAMDDDRDDPLREHWGVRKPGDVEGFRRRFEAAADREITGPETVILCNEHCHSRLRTPAEVGRLRDFLVRYFDDIRIVVYLRRQDQLALSLYTTRLKSGGTSADVFPRTNSEDPFFNYDRSLTLWEEAFGRQNMTVKVFERDALTEGSIIADVLATCGIGPANAFVPVNDCNESIMPKAQEFLRRINAHLSIPAGTPREAYAGRLSAFLTTSFAGRGMKPSRADAEAFYAKFADSNRAVAARYFEGAQRLFSERFDGYPAAAETAQLSVEEAMEISARLYEGAQDEIRRLEAELEVRTARIELLRGEVEKALQRMGRTARVHSRHAPVFRMLGECQFRADRVSEAAASAERAVSLNPAASEYWHFLGHVRAHTGDRSGAEEAQRKALACDGANAAARAALERLLATETP